MAGLKIMPKMLPAKMTVTKELSWCVMALTESDNGYRRLAKNRDRTQWLSRQH